MSREEFGGGCFCGAVRIRVVGPPNGVVYCHCDDCRRWSGAPVTVFAGCSTEQVRMLGDEPEVYDSSPGTRRSFCGSCGTSFSYEDERLPGEIYLAIGILDEPERFEPQRHSWFSRRMDWLQIEDELPRSEKSSRPR